MKASRVVCFSMPCTFVRVGPGLYMRTDVCVAFVECEVCGAGVGALCIGPRGPKGGTHYQRRRAYASRRRT